MNEKIDRLAARRAMLIARAASQREELAQAAMPWRASLAVIDRGLSIARYLRQHPVFLLAAATTAALMRPRRLFKWIKHGWLAWRLLLGVRRRLSGR